MTTTEAILDGVFGEIKVVNWKNLAWKDRCLNRCNISFAISRVEDCLELNFKYVDYQTLAHLSYSSSWPLCTQKGRNVFLSVRVLISDSTCGSSV